MTDKRRLTMAVTIYVTADLKTDGDDTNVGLVSAQHNLMGGLITIEGVPAEDTTPAWREAVASSSAKLALQYTIEKLNGLHTEPVPVVNSPGADA